MKLLILLAILNALVALSLCSDITNIVFGKELDGLPAAFGDFNSDELTDVFVLSKDGKSVQIMLASVEEPLLQPRKELICPFDRLISSVVPGDFDGDAFMDILVTTSMQLSNITNVHILWGGTPQLNCTDAEKPLLQMIGQPIALDYNHDMIIDLFGTDVNGTRTYWIFNDNRTMPTVRHMTVPLNYKADKLAPIRMPHSNAFFDLDNDYYSDLIITTDNSIEVWSGREEGFVFSQNIPLKVNPDLEIGQALYLDVELRGKIDLILPYCTDASGRDSKIMIYSNNNWTEIEVNFRDKSGNEWGFAKDGSLRYTNTITMRGGDFNMDGYPDLLATLRSVTDPKMTRSFLLENVPRDNDNLKNSFNRTFKIQWNALNPFRNESVMAAFYDFYQDGILDVIFVLRENDVYKTAAFKNSLDYDANFVKVMVITGRTNSMYPISPGTLGKKKRTYGTNLPGPSIAYKIITQDGYERNAIAAQLPQSAHYSLNLPFTIFGLDRTPNFIDSITIGLSPDKHRDWPQIIPNSQMVVIPNPLTDTSRWKVQLFVTPSKLILLSAAALSGTCGLITLIIAALYWKERREDKIEKLQEAHRFHFDAM